MLDVFCKFIDHVLSLETWNLGVTANLRAFLSMLAVPCWSVGQSTTYFKNYSMDEHKICFIHLCFLGDVP